MTPPRSGPFLAALHAVPCEAWRRRHFGISASL